MYIGGEKGTKNWWHSEDSTKEALIIYKINNIFNNPHRDTKTNND